MEDFSVQDYSRWAAGSLVRDFVYAWGSTALATCALYALAVGLAFGWTSLSTYAGSLTIALILGAAANWMILSRITARRVGASSRGFAIVRPGKGLADFEAFDWGALMPGSRSTWTPYLGRKFPVRIVHAAGLGIEAIALNREQAELLVSFPQGAKIQSLLQ